jgi:hypothetical protein
MTIGAALWNVEPAGQREDSQQDQKIRKELTGSARLVSSRSPLISSLLIF